MSLAVAIGKFDALHLGHRALIDAAAAAGQPALLSFSGMAEVLGWAGRKPLLIAAERQRVLGQWSGALGQVIRAIDVPFQEVRALSPAAFIDYLRQHFDISAIITGENFRFGYQRSGDVETLRQLAQQYQYQVKIVESVTVNQVHASSSGIRTAISHGDCALAQQLLGRAYCSQGLVVRGDGRGRQLGFPTANIAAIENHLPLTGVYAATVYLADNSAHTAAINIGHLPSIGDDRPLSVEAHILDWSGDCYGQELRIEWIKRIRDEMKFNGVDALVAQIQKDLAIIQSLSL